MTRVALVDLPGLLVDVVRDALDDEPDVEVEVLGAGLTPGAILVAEADVVMVGVASPSTYAQTARLLRERPDLGLFAISLDARRAWIYELCPCARELAEVSGPSLRAAVRGVTERNRAERDRP